MSVLNEAHFHDEEAAFAKLESIVWPDGPVCPHCGALDRIYAAQRRALKAEQEEPAGHRAPRPQEVRPLPEAIHCPMRHGVREQPHPATQVVSGRTPAVLEQEGHQQPSTAPRPEDHLRSGLVHAPPHSRGHAHWRARPDGRRWWHRGDRRDFHRPQARAMPKNTAAIQPQERRSVARGARRRGAQLPRRRSTNATTVMPDHARERGQRKLRVDDRRREILQEDSSATSSPATTRVDHSTGRIRALRGRPPGDPHQHG